MTKSKGFSFGPSGVTLPAGAGHAESVEKLLELLHSERDRGLTEAEALLRLEQLGGNELPGLLPIPLWRLVYAQFRSPLILLLVVAAAISGALGHLRDAAVIVSVLLFNAIVGAFQERRADHAMLALKRLVPLTSRVVRSGVERMVDARELVVGDIVLVSAGDKVGADARLLEAVHLEAGEAAITGEAVPVSKKVGVMTLDSGLSERSNILFAGTLITRGRGRALVFAAGFQTEVGRIARMTGTGLAARKRTPLETRLQQLGGWVFGGAVAVFGLVLCIGLLREISFLQIFMVAVSEMVSMVPEGLPAALTVGFAVGMQRMARRGVIVRRLSAVETLGSCDVICTDKTGTLTSNEMTVTSIWLANGQRYSVTGAGYSPEGGVFEGQRRVLSCEDPSLRRILEAVVLCNDAGLVPPSAEDSIWKVLGDPTEAALLVVAMKAGMDPARVCVEWPRRGEVPFDSSSRLMATLHGDRGLHRILLKGAPEALLRLSAGGDRLRECWRARVLELAAEPLRVVAVGDVEGWTGDLEGGLDAFAGRVRLLGLVGQMDPLRSDALEAVHKCKAAGIRPVMVTGDHKANSLAVARLLGIAAQDEEAMDGPELEKLSDLDLGARVDEISVFARVEPAQKLRLVQALQRKGHVVAMTGDGVNDGPALAAADVGVAMGRSGTDLARGASAIILTDDNFASIVKGVEEGRLVYRNLRKVVLFLFSTSLDEVVFLLLALVIGHPLPLTAVQILWINVVTEGLVTVNLIMEAPEGDEMQHKPPAPGEPVLTWPILGRLFLMVGASVAVLLGYFEWTLGRGEPLEAIRAEIFTLIAVCQWFNVLSCRSRLRSALSLDLFQNGWLAGGLALAVLLQCLVLYLEPLNRVFETAPIPLERIVVLLIAASGVLWVEEVRKLVARRMAGRGARI